MNDVLLAFGDDGFGAYSVTWSPSGPELEPSSQKPSGVLAPGFVDIHIHGAFGVDFMTAPSGDVTGALDKLGERGYEQLLLTSVTAPAEAVADFLSRVPSHDLVAGVHLEGPFISPRYPGAQPPSAIASPPGENSSWSQVLADPRVKVVTMAPELPGSIPLIEDLASKGVRVGMGHTDATFAQARAGFDAGATHTTHTYNAMRPLHHREAGTVGFALLEPGLAAELIYDRVHVVKEAAELLIRNKPDEKLIAVSDGTMASGLAEGTRLTMWGLEVEVGAHDVRLLDGTLAGSKIDLLDAFQNLWQDFGPETAIRATSYNPRRLLGLHRKPQVWLQFNTNMELVRRHRCAPADA